MLWITKRFQLGKRMNISVNWLLSSKSNKQDLWAHSYSRKGQYGNWDAFNWIYRRHRILLMIYSCYRAKSSLTWTNDQYNEQAIFGTNENEWKTIKSNGWEPASVGIHFQDIICSNYFMGHFLLDRECPCCCLSSTCSAIESADFVDNWLLQLRTV